MISLRKTNILAQVSESPSVITIDNTELEVVDTFTYLGSTVSSLTSLDAEISCRITKAAAVMAKLNKRVWGNDLLRERTKMCVYQACVLSTLLYGRESWTTYARQERQLDGFHLRCLRRLLHIRWRDRVTNTKVLECAGSLSMSSLLIQRHLRWLGHAYHMEPDRLPREILYGELREGIHGSTAAALQGRHLACEYSRLSSLTAAWAVAQAAVSDERRLYSQARTSSSKTCDLH